MQSFNCRLVLFCAIGIVLRLGLSWQLAGIDNGRNSVVSPAVTTDLRTYMDLSGAVMESGWPETAFDYQPFYYTVFLPVVKAIGNLFGAGIWSVIVAQALLGGAVIFLAGLCGRRAGGSKAGLLAAGLCAFAQSLVLYTPFHAIVTLQSFWLVFTLYCTLRSISGRWYWLPAAGISAGCGILTRGNFWFVVPVLLAAVIFCRRYSGGRALRYLKGTALAAGVLAAVIAVQVPYIIHNSRICGTLTGPSVASDKVLALGNSPEAPPGGRQPGLPAGPMEYPEVWIEWMAQQDEVPVRDQVFRWISEEPRAFVELSFRKALLFWDHREIPNNIGFRVDPEYGVAGELDNSGGWGYMAFVSSGLLLVLGLAGMLLTAGRAFCFCRRGGSIRIIWWWIIAYWMGVTAFYMLERFRAPVLPELAVTGGIWISFLIRKWRRLGRKGLSIPLLLLLLSAWVVYFSCDFYRTVLEADVLRIVLPEGVKYQMRDGVEVRQDHSSMVSGDWQPLELKSGDILTKVFSGAAGKDGIVEIAFILPPRGSAKVNGIYISSRAGGLEWIKIPVSANGKGEIILRVESISRDGGVIIDRCRDFGRSYLNSQTQDGEFVAKMRFQTSGS